MCVSSAIVLIVNIEQAAEMLAKYCKADDISFGIITKAVELENNTTFLQYAIVLILADYQDHSPPPPCWQRVC